MNTNAFLEMHLLQNFAPSNLNRDDTNSPKDAVFGGYRRARISSQCLKRAMRTYVKGHRLLDSDHMGQRTKRLVEAIAEGLQGQGREAVEASRVAEFAFGGLGLKTKDGVKSEYLIFLGQGELKRIVTAIQDHWESLVAAISKESGDGKGKAKGKEAKKVSKEAVPDEVRKALEKAVRSREEGGDAVDLAFFGRMLADKPEKNQDAACQVAHAISTHRVDREFDFYTAVDDRKPEDSAGADMLGTVEFNSACYYRYLNVDLNLLRRNLQGDDELLEKGLRAFLKAAILALPTGKQNSFAAHNPPSFMAFTIRKSGSPRNLANAFAAPAFSGSASPLTEKSLEKLAHEWDKMDKFFGEKGDTFFWNGTEQGFPIGLACETCEDLLKQSTAAAMAALEG